MPEPKGTLIVPVGFRASGLLRALALDDSDYLKVAIGAWLEGQVDIAGYAGGAWHKQPILLGYSGVVGEQKVNNALLAGLNDLSSVAVPAGEVWTVSTVAIRYTGTVPTFVTVFVARGGVAMNIQHQLAPVSAQWYIREPRTIMVDADTIVGRVSGATAGDAMVFAYLGHKTSINL